MQNYFEWVKENPRTSKDTVGTYSLKVWEYQQQKVERLKNTSKYIGKTVQVKDRNDGIIVGTSQRYNGTWVILIDGINEEIHDCNVTKDGLFLEHTP